MSEQEPAVDAKRSLCWTCKHGMCVQETESQTMLHEPLPGPPPQKPDIFSQFEEQPPQEESGPLLEHVTLRRIQAICFWRPANVPNSPPVRVSEVTQCSRHEKQ